MWGCRVAPNNKSQELRIQGSRERNSDHSIQPRSSSLLLLPVVAERRRWWRSSLTVLLLLFLHPPPVHLLRWNMEAALGLMRRIHPKHSETALSALLGLLPHHSSDLLSQVDQPLQVSLFPLFCRLFSFPFRFLDSFSLGLFQILDFWWFGVCCGSI